MKNIPTVTGPLGFPMREDHATIVEKVLKSLPKDHTYRRKGTVVSDLELVEGERADVSLVSTNAVDREGDVVLPSGVDLTYFRQNPVVTLSHKWEELPVGRCKWIKDVEKGILAKTVYAKRPDEWQGPWIPDAIFSLTQQDILRGKSIGFLPTRIRSATQEELKANPHWHDARGIIESAILLEYAVAPLPCNPECLTLAVSKGLANPALLKRLGLVLPPTKKQPPVNLVDLFTKALSKINLDPNQAAEEAIKAMYNRGKI